MSESGKRNLRILAWMGLACQAIGVVSALSNFVGLQWGTVQGGFAMLIFGMALGGWAGNLLEIAELKERLAKLEGGTATPTSAVSDS